MKRKRKRKKSSSAMVLLIICTVVLVCIMTGAFIVTKYHDYNAEQNSSSESSTASSTEKGTSSLGKAMLQGISGWLNKHINGDDPYDIESDPNYDEDGNYIFDYNDAYAWVFPGMSLEAKKATLFPAEQMQEFMDEYVNKEDSLPVPLVGRVFDNSVIPYDGQERSITCWGDSMTEGNGTNPASIVVDGEEFDISYITFPSTVEMLSGITAYNLGVGGETSQQIAERQGGLPLYTDRDLTIKDYGAESFNLLNEDGMIEYFNDYSGYGLSNELLTNRVYIDGNYFKMTFNGESHMLYKKIKPRTSAGSSYTATDNGITAAHGENTTSSTAKADGTASGSTEKKQRTYEIPAWSRVYTKAAIDRKDDILIIEMGSNGGWNDDLSVLVAQYDAMIESANCQYYIIIGDTDDPSYDAGIGETAWEATLREAFGEHFINMRLYLIENGLKDCGLAPTFADMEGYCNGEISKQLRSDWTHLNAYGYYSKGLAVYNKGIELGYWD